MRLIGACLIGLFVLAGCGEPGDSPVAGATAATMPSTVQPVDTSQPPPTLVEVAAVYERVRYYGACGNEIVVVGGTTYYPILNEAYPRPDGEVPRIDPGRYTIVGALLGMLGAVGAVPRVAPPGPGDDIGEMVVYADGMARFESDSGWVIWLTNQEQTYGWEC